MIETLILAFDCVKTFLAVFSPWTWGSNHFTLFVLRI